MTTLREELSKKLNKKEMDLVKTSYDVLGSIAIIEIPDELEKKEKIIGETLLRLHNHVETVLKKAGIHSGKYRRQKLKVIAGKRTKVAEYKENNARLRLDVEKVYFSSRSGTERKRIFQQVKKGETVLVMFSGCAPYPVVIGRNTDAGHIYGVELNPIGHKFAEENVKLNKLENVTVLEGDVRKVVPKLKKKFDRIIMPLPKLAESFLDVAFDASKKGTVIHLYCFTSEDLFDELKEKIKKRCKDFGKKCKIMDVVKCGHYSPRVYRICVDFKIMS